ncbi:alpha/beta hydrolase [Salicibibacter cibarius]|uniref:Alpha/beta hydrolase n=1 Tax=Salicibibacter cibarius TaxID=2743000 RepID=A0A7T6Z5Y3_9BACI|nr:alpha/beta hydrolase [Salicibibacter cibarius]QQK77423.1 alpha/beta hydrolase [Salicibibacter cibarius]
MRIWKCENPIGVIVIVHGAGEHYGRYQWLIERLNKEHFHVVAGDLPGFGRTRGKRGHIDHFNQYIDSIHHWYKEAAVYNLPVFLFGHSLGGLGVIRTMMEKQLPVRGVILSSPCLHLYDPPKKGSTLLARGLHKVIPTFSMKTGIRVEQVTRDEETKRELLKDELYVHHVTVRWYQELAKAMKTSLEHAYQFPNVPLLTLQSGEDYLVDKRVTHEWFNRLRLEDRALREWRGLYHEIFSEPEREEVFRFMLYFIWQRLGRL